MEGYWEWLCSVPGIYRIQIEILLYCFHTPEGVYLASDQELDHLRKKGSHWVEQVVQYRKSRSLEDIVHIHRDQGIQFISQEHPMYPRRLKDLRDKPYGLFYRGRLPEEERKSVGIVGARMCTRAGKERAEQIAAGIADMGGQVISGAAYGIDGAAQWMALQRGGSSFAVLGCGVDCCYPAAHVRLFEELEKNGGILSEYPPGTAPRSVHFPQRNRIISGLSDLVVVVEARRKSGSLITAEYAADQGRPVMAIPGRIEDELSEGCNELISQGAGMILSVDSFLKSLFSDYKKENRKLSGKLALAPGEKLVYSSLDLHSKTLWELEDCTALSLAELGEVLMSLELKGLVCEKERGCYVRTYG